MGEVGRNRDRRPMPGFCDIVMHSAFAAWSALWTCGKQSGLLQHEAGEGGEV